jgi:fimbrial isopeptide formation D2 family protein
LQKDKVWDPYTNSPYRGEKFYIDENFIYTPGATNIRIPLLPKDFKPLIVKKSVSASYATIGDFVKWTITVNNPNDNYIIYSVNLIDVLPKPFRYKENTTKVDGNSYSEPEISKDGITLRWYLGNLKPHETKTITFYTIVGANARNGKYKNTAYAYGWSDENKSLLIPSNTAYAYIKLSRGIFGEKCYILGDIFVDTNNNLKRDNGEEGLKNVRIYLEDGRYTLTDKEGKFHFDNVNPGTHVVVIDKNSLPPGAIVNLSDLQSLNSNSSLLVDLYPGDIYRISIPVKLTQHATQQAIVLNRTIADVRLEANSKEYYLLNLLKLKNKSKELIYNVIIKECNTSKPLEGTVSLNEAPFENPTMENGCFYWKIPVILPNEEVNLTWYSLIDKYKAGIPEVIVTYENEYGLKQEQKIELPSWIYKKDGQYILKVNKKVYNGERKDAETLNGLSKLLNQIPIKNLKVESINAEKAQQVQKPINKY